MMELHLFIVNLTNINNMMLTWCIVWIIFTGGKIGCGFGIETKICIVTGAEVATNSKWNQMTAVSSPNLFCFRLISKSLVLPIKILTICL